MRLETKGLNVGYGKKVVLSGISIEVRAGEILTLIGPNGAGKSTVLKSIASQLTPLGGAIYLEGRDMKAMKEKEIAREMSVLLTERSHPELVTCREVISLGRYPYTGYMGVLSEEDNRRVDEAMSLVAVSHLAETDFGCISDGQKQRVLLARALCQEPKVLIMDEPTSYLDIHHKTTLLNVLKNMVTEKNIAVVLSLHELDLAQKISDNVLCISRFGDIAKYGPPEEIFHSADIEDLFGMDCGSYNAVFASPELPPVKGQPRVFVIGGCGLATDTYRRLQRKGIPFATGVLHENDLDYPVAAALSAEMVSEKPYTAITRDHLEAAKGLLSTCRQLVCPLPAFGGENAANAELVKEAERLAIPVTDKWQEA